MTWLVAAVVLAGAVFLATRSDLVTTVGSEDPLPAHLQAFAGSGPIRVGWTEGTDPISIWDGDELVGGYAVELWNLAAIKLGFMVEHHVFEDNEALVRALRAGVIDLAGAHGERPDLREFAEPTDPIAWERITFVGAPDQASAITGTLAGSTVSTVAGSPLVIALRARYPDATYVETPSIEAGLTATARGEIDLYLAPLAIAGYVMRQQDLDLIPVGDAVEQIHLAGWARAGSQALELAQAGRAGLTAEEISLITVRWTGFDLGSPEDTIPTWLPRALAIALVLASTFAVFVLILRRRVRAATAELSQTNAELAALNADLEERVAGRTSELAAAVDRLNRSNLGLSEFARAVAHDLRGPVTAIYGMSSLLRSIDVEQSQQDTMLAAIEQGSSRLTAMIETLLDDAIRAGADDPGLDGGEFAGWLRDIVGTELQAIGATLHVDVPDGNIPVDAAALRRSALNLVGNALKYATSPAGTRVRVRLAPADPGAWVLTVDDNGPGIPEALWSRIFDPGYRRSTDDRGHGLGLSDTRETVERVGGSVHVGVGHAGGARFTVILPVRTGATTDDVERDDRPSLVHP